MKPYILHHDYMMKYLADPTQASSYLNCVAEDDDVKFFMEGLRDVVEAQGGIGKLAKQTGLSRTTLYKTLSEDGNPEYATLKTILDVYNLQISIIPKKDSGGKKAA